ncbi:MAG: molybdopterin-dependent oxidoreductase [Acidimicrobiia bacterium]|nr:molybdopterin-dependent oxidoreductase [Acidimicrobiia bacterium]
MSGFIAAGLALGVAELLAGFTTSVPPIIESVGDYVIENGWQTLDNWSRETFGSGQKRALVTGITVASLVIGAITGVLSRSRPIVGPVVFTLFAVVGGLAATQDELANATGGWIVSIVAGLAGMGALALMLRSARHITPTSDSTSRLSTFVSERRRFLTTSVAAGFTGLFSAMVGNSLRQQRNIEADRAELATQLASTDAASPATALAPSGSLDDVPGISSLVTSNDDFYRIDTAISPPLLDPDTWTLSIDGMVDDPYELSFSDLLDMDVVEAPVTLSCVSNEIGGNLVGNAIWRGVPLIDVLERAGVHDDATQIVGRSADGWTAGFPTAAASDGRTALVAFAMNGEPLPLSHGFPARLVVAGLYGYVSATKWLTEIELTTWDDFDGFWIPRGWAKEGPIKTQSRIDVPRRGDRITPGPTAIAGVAWAPTRSVGKVEVRIDEGSWIEASLSDELSDESWRQWFHEWDATPGDHVIQVRSTDGEGETQTAELADPRPDGATGWHTVAVRVED